VPSFTHNWLARMNPGRMPRPFSRFDVVALAAAGVALALWVAVPESAATGFLMVLASILHGTRLARWAGDRTVTNRLVLVLHVAYAFVPLGFLLTGLSILWPALPLSAGIHAWTSGAAGLMTLAVMTRATLGHTGQKLESGAVTQVIYLLALIAALARMLAPFIATLPLLHIAAFAWMAAFSGFTIVYGRLLLRPHASSKAPS
jgi:uncharacterized protein involved in response to NO